MISSILLAAGQSTRMGKENKLTREINGIPLIKHTINNILSSSIDELIIVLGYQKEIIENFIDNNDKIKIVFNNQFKSGMASSIKTGVKNLSTKTEAFFVCLGDMPEVNKEIYNDLIKQLKNNKIIVPTYKNKQGNPVLFSKSLKEKIMTIDGDSGAKKILEKNSEIVFNFEVNNQAILKNYNTPDSFNI